MHDSETQAAVERIQQRNLWAVGWFLCVVVTLMTSMVLVLDWKSRGSLGKFSAISFLFYLLLWPAVLAYRRYRKAQISAAQVFIGTYVLLMLAVQALGMFARAH
jgi:hypothetical protein